jgi:hypothetical protein
MIRNSRPYLPWREICDPVKLWLCWRVSGHTLLNMAGLVNVINLARRLDADGIKGAFVECGVWRGGSAGVMAIVARRQHRRLWLFDSFVGMPEATTEDVGPAADALAAGCKTGRLVATGSYAAPRQFVEDLLFGKLGIERRNVEIREGWFQDTVGKARQEVGAISLLRLDGDWYESTRTCLEAFYDQVAAGGFVIVDDYGAFEGCRKAVDEFMTARGESPGFHRVDDTRIYFRK